MKLKSMESAVRTVAISRFVAGDHQFAGSLRFLSSNIASKILQKRSNLEVTSKI
jgi:hypothetical protein